MRHVPPASAMHSISVQMAAAGRVQLLGRTGLAVCLCAAALMLTGCQTFGPPDITGSIGVPATPPDSPQALADYTTELGGRYDANPNDRNVTLAYAEALRKQTRYAQAVAVLQHYAAQHPKDMTVLGAYGKALVDAGRLQEAADVYGVLADQNLWVYEALYLEGDDRVRPFLTPGGFVPFAARWRDMTGMEAV